MCELTLIPSGIEIVFHLSLQTVRINAGITVVSSNNSSRNCLKNKDAKCVNLINCCDLLPQEGVNPKDSDVMILLQQSSFQDSTGEPKYSSQPYQHMLEK